MELIDDVIETKDPHKLLNNTDYFHNYQQLLQQLSIPENLENKINYTEKKFFTLSLLKKTSPQILNSYPITKWYNNIFYSFQPTKIKRNSCDTISYLQFKEKENVSEKFFTALEESYYEHIEVIKDIPLTIIQKEMEYLLKTILTYNILHNNIIIGISNDASAYIYTEKDNKKITIDLFFEYIDDSYEIDALLNIVENKNNICSYSNTVPLVLERVSKFLV